MKKLFLLIALAAIVASCEDENDFRIKSTDMISLRPAAGTAMKVKATDQTHLSALEIVRQTTEISLIMHGGSYEGIKAGRSFAGEQRDTISITPKLLMWATDVIDLDGNLQLAVGGFIDATDVVLVHYKLQTPTIRDTIAYVPNSVLRAAETAIRAAYEAKDLEACYTAFNTAYTFTPITGPEWREIKLAGTN